MEIVDHWVEGARRRVSSNWNERPTAEISLIVVHGISLPVGHFGGDYVAALFLNELDTSVHPDFVSLEGVKVSSHLYIRRDGTLDQFVALDKRAWHAGASRFGERENCNDFSIGIELEGTDTSGYREAQYLTLARTTRSIIDKYEIPSGHVAGHSDIAPGRKTDPGPRFDWDGFRKLLDSGDVDAAGVVKS